MKIRYTSIDTVTFSDLAAGTIFTDGDKDFYIKTTRTTYGYNATKLNNGEICSFHDEDEVKPLEAELVIKN